MQGQGDRRFMSDRLSVNNAPSDILILHCFEYVAQRQLG
jgi:hypothetical protein